jgi:hypothetical protein
MGTRRLALLTATASLAAAASGCGDGSVAGLEAGSPERAAPRAEAALRLRAAAPVTGPRELPVSIVTGHVRRDAALTEMIERRRLTALARARRSPTVPGALRAALLSRRITGAEHGRLRAEYAASRAALRRLQGAPRAELTAVMRSVEALASSHRLHASRFEPVFLVLRRNREYWSRHASPPAAGYRVAFGRDPAVFQYYPGQGVQLQQLASWGRLNARLEVCLRKPACRFAELRRQLARMVELGSQRSGFLAWEYYFAFGGGTPPWISGMTQGTAVQALARGAIVFGEDRWEHVAERALGAFQAAPPAGVSVEVPGGRHYAMYSFNPGLRVLNGDLQAITGLRDLADLGGSRAARALSASGKRAARRAVDRFDTGAWSLYSDGGREAPLGYHQLVRQFLDNLCRRTGRAVYCAARTRFARYELEPPRIRMAALHGLRAKRETSVRFGLSKISTVSVRVTGGRGFSMTRSMSLPRGVHAVAWTPPARGTYRVRISAKGPSGPLGASSGQVRVVLPRPVRKERAQPPSTPGTAPLRKASTKRR